MRGDSSAFGHDDTAARLVVVATTAPVADLVRKLGGDHVSVRTIAVAGTNPNGLRPGPKALALMRKAMLVVTSGDGIDDWSTDLLAAVGHTRTIMVGFDRPIKLTDAQGRVDPHWWHDPDNMLNAVDRLSAVLIRLLPGAAAEIKASTARYKRQIAATTTRVQTCLQKIPAARRRIAPGYDGLRYYTRRFQLTPVATLTAPQNDRTAPTAAQITAFTLALKGQGRTAVLPESSWPKSVTRRLKRASSRPVRRSINTYTLGKRGTRAADYQGMLLDNTDAIVDELSAGRVRCK